MVYGVILSMGYNGVDYAWQEVISGLKVYNTMKATVLEYWVKGKLWVPTTAQNATVTKNWGIDRKLYLNFFHSKPSINQKTRFQNKSVGQLGYTTLFYLFLVL